MNLPNGYTLQNGKYKLTQVVGQGGFGITYSGVWFTEVKGPLGALRTEIPICVKEYFFKDYCYRDTETQAVKVHSETGRILFDKFKEKLIKEAKILSDVTHPYIVNVLEVFEENETAYIVMEYIAGCSLKYMLDKTGVLPENKALKYTRQIGEALMFVHENNILHLDIKPSNILIDKNDHARLIDFGVSKRYDLEEQETSTTMLTLSKGFASIEQYDNEGTQVFSPCPDIYSLGATMYNLLTGKIPTESILRATKPLVNPSVLNPAISSKTEAAILKAMEIIPENRFQTAKELLDALDIPEETAEASNPLREQVDQDDEKTQLWVDNEKTVLNLPNQTNKDQTNSPKKRKRIWVGMAIGLSAIFLLAILLITQQNQAQSENMKTEATLPEIQEAGEKDVSEQNDPTLMEQGTASETVEDESASVLAQTQEEGNTAANRDNHQPPTVPVSRSENQEQTVRPSTEPEATMLVSEPTPAEIEANYSMLIASGKQKMDIFDFSGAKKDLLQARTIKRTDEVESLLTRCYQEEEEKQIADRMLLYEEKMPFGFLKIVRKKENGKPGKFYGAINNRAEEVIPCKYIGVGIAEGGRAFEREDHLFDIYNSEGVRLGEGLTYY
jgi:serine/threonine protein kinase